MAGGQAGLGWTYASPAAQHLVTGMLAGVVQGREGMDVAGCYEAMCRAVRNVGREGIAAAATSAVDVALCPMTGFLVSEVRWDAHEWVAVLLGQRGGRQVSTSRARRVPGVAEVCRGGVSWRVACAGRVG
jgi:hypothetical protein